MISVGNNLWRKHPHVRTDDELTFGERAADILKAAFGTWTLLFSIVVAICLWMTIVRDPGELRLNLALSFLASVQGVILQIAANRGDRISSEVAIGTHQMAQKLLDINNKQTQMLEEIKGLRAAFGAISDNKEAVDDE